MAFVLGKQLSRAEWINWWCQLFSLSLSKGCECLSLSWPDQHMLFSPTQSIKLNSLAQELHRKQQVSVASTQQLETLRMVTVSILETSNGDHFGIAIELCIDMAVFC